MTPLQLLFRTLQSSTAPTLESTDDRQRALLAWLQRHTADVAGIPVTIDTLPFLLGMALNDMFRQASDHLRNDLGRNAILDEVLADPDASLWANCGDASDFYLAALQAFGISGNLVSVWHSENDGHTLVQFFDAGRGAPVLYDPFYATVFLDALGQPLSLSDVMASDRSLPASTSGITATRIGLEPAVSSVFQYYQSLDYQAEILGTYFRHVALRLESPESVANYDTVWRAYPTVAGLHSGAWLMLEEPGLADDARARFDDFLRSNFSLDGPGRYLLSSVNPAGAADRASTPHGDAGLAMALDAQGRASLHDMTREGALLAQFDTAASAVAGRIDAAGTVGVAIDDHLGQRSCWRVIDGEVTLLGSSQGLGTLRGWVDVDGDGSTDLLSSDAQAVYVMTQQGALSSSLQWTGSTRLHALGDFNGDGLQDMLVATSADRLAIVARSDDSWTAQPILARLAAGFTPVGIADVNGDGTDDLLLADAQQGLHVWIMHLGQLVGAAKLGQLPSGEHVAGVLDHGDGRAPDLLLADASGRQRLLLSQGDHHVLAALPALPGAAASTQLHWGTLGQVDTTPWVMSGPLADGAAAPSATDAATIAFTSTRYIGGRAAIEDQHVGSALVARTRFDIDGSFQWSQTTDRFDAAGQLVASSTWRDSGARDETTYGDDGPGSWRTDYLDVDASLTMRIAAAADGSRSYTHLDAAGTQSWRQYTDVHDAAGQLRQRLLVRDSGAQEVQDFDATSAATWVMRFFDDQGTLTLQEDTLAGSVRARTFHDHGNSFAWSSYTDHYDPAGALVSRTVMRDSGACELTTFESTDRLVQRTDHLRADGTRWFQARSNADGSTDLTTYDADELATWSSYTNHIVAGFLQRQDLVRDDGRREISTFDADHPATRSTDYVDAEGLLALREVLLDGGEVDLSYFDRHDEQSWTSYRDHFDADANRTAREVLRDNGAREVTEFDVQDQHPWVSSTSYYDPLGALLAKVFEPPPSGSA